MDEKSKKEMIEVLKKKNHRVLVVTDTIPSVGRAVTDYIHATGLGVIGVTNSRFGTVFILANGANIVFAINMPSVVDHFQMVIDETEVKEAE